MQKKLLLPLALLLCPLAPANAQPSTALRGAHILDGQGGSIDNATIIIEGQKIRAVGKAGQIKIPRGAAIIECQGKTIMPGLISNHSHLGLTEGAKSDPGADSNRANVMRQLKQYEAYGVTTVTSLGMNLPAVFYPIRTQQHAGGAPGADVFGADKGLGVPDGAPPVKATQVQLDRPATAPEARQDVDAAARRQTDLIKLWLDDFGGTLPVEMSPEISTAIIDQAHKDHLRVAAHIFKLDDARSLVAENVDILAHGVRDLPVDRPFIDSLKQKKLWYIPTISLDESFYIYAQRPEWMNGKFFKNAVQPALQAQFDDPAWRKKTLNDPHLGEHQKAVSTNQKNLLKLYRAGVMIGFGTDSGATPLRIPGFAEHRELQLLQKAGLTPTEAITLATGRAAALLHLDDRGVIAPGKLADLIVLDADPSVDIKNTEHIVQVWHRGKKVSGPIENFRP